MFETACRPSEVVHLLRGDVHLDGEPHLVVRGGKTPSAARRVPLTSVAVELLRRRLNEVRGLALFPSQKSRDVPIDTLDRKAHRRACAKAGVKFFTPYCGRH